MRFKQAALLLSATALLSGCFTTAQDFKEPARPADWTARRHAEIEAVNATDLEAWWKKFDDQTLNNLVDLALATSPDREIAKARIEEARGLRRTTHASLLPQIGASAQRGREDAGLTGPSSFYDAGFDASFEIDIFGRTQRAKATDATLEAMQAAYHDVSLSLIAEIARNYIDLRAAQTQARIAEDNLRSQQKTLGLIENLNRLGDAPKLDVDRAQALVSATRASIPAYRRAADNARLRLSVLTGMMPEHLLPMLKDDEKIPGANVRPVLMAPAQVLSLRPDVKAASANLAASTALAESAAAEFFPLFNLSGFYGISDGAAVSSATIWSVAAGAAVTLLDFGRIEGRIDTARAREMQAYHQYRKTILAAVTDVETALNDYAWLNEEYLSQKKAYESAESALSHSQNLYKEGEISFLDVLDAQRGVNSAQAAMVGAQAAQMESLVRLYKSLGVY